MTQNPHSLITWNSRFNTGHTQIDAQHQELVSLLNRFSAAIQSGGASGSALFDSFTRALRNHFVFEENALRELGTPPDILDAHRNHHAESLLLLKSLSDQLATDPGEHSSAVLAEIAHCLLFDLLDEDRYCFVTAATNGDDSASPPVAPVLLTFKRMVEMLNQHHERIAEARDYYLTLLNDFPTPVLRADTLGHFDWFNRTWLKLTGLKSEEAGIHGWIDALHPDDRTPFMDGWRSSFEARTPIATDYRLRDAAGTWHWIHHFGHPFYDNDGTLLGYLCTLFDITERKKDEANLRVSATVFEHATDAIMITDPGGRIEGVNPAFSRMTGYSSIEAIGQPANLLRSGFHDGSFYKSMWQQVLAEGSWEGEVVNRRASGELFPVWLSITSIREDDGEITRMVGVFNDISSQQSSRKQLMHLAHHDALTGLPNRLLFDARAQHSLERCIREQSRLAILFIDLDDFKPVNDQLGHKAGDRVLCEVAQRLREALRGEDTVARFGGDEFVVLVERSENIEDAHNVAQKLLELFPILAKAGTLDLAVSASIGVSLYPDDGRTVDELIEAADHAMYRIKRTGQPGTIHTGPHDH
jgi:diguanylate cyclase (GGDEF)-like protein/PAS domain S-box-containing protein/hemerythrin-like metal-binding protein